MVAALLAELGLVLANVLARAWFHHSFLWADEAARLALSILAFIGGAVAYRRRDHAFVRIVLNLVPAPIERICLVLSDVIVLFVVSLTGIASVEFIASSWSERTPILQLPAALIALPLPIGMALLALFALFHLWREHRSTAPWVAGGFAVVMAAATLTRDAWLPLLGGDAAIVVALALFFVAIFAGVPVGFVLLLATATYLWASDAASMVVLPQTMVNGTGNFILLAVPFFILAGLIMERGGISVRLVRFIHTLVGHMRGGLLQVTVVSMYIVSGLSGSKPADVAAVGTVMRDQLRERHGAAEGAAVLAASAIMGETVPPSIAMLIVGSITSVSVGGDVHRRPDPGRRDGALPDGAHLRARAPRRCPAPAARAAWHHRARRPRRRAAAADARHAARRHPVRARDADRGRGARGRLRPVPRRRRLSRDGRAHLHAHGDRHGGADRRSCCSSSPRLRDFPGR